MAEGGEQLELKFRIFDGTDIGHGSYSSFITVATLKQRLLSEWPQVKQHSISKFSVGSSSISEDILERMIVARTSFELFYEMSIMKAIDFSDKSVVPKSMNDMKIIHAGKVLENGKTLAESRAHVSDLPGGVITMHVVVQPAVVKKKTDKNLSGKQKQGSCSCTIL